MALHVSREGVKHVPWFSPAEWHAVYKQIYSNDTEEQNKGYERLLVWKARVPKLPVGVDCTLSIVQVCLRDREFMKKIDHDELPAYYENDLSLMYSTTLMRFLNHIANIGQTKQSSLFQIAKQLKIPEWIVNLRHDAAHGHELPSISVFRIATNVLLEWLHEEYWAAEAKAIEASAGEEINAAEQEEILSLGQLMELWTATGLYIHAGYESIDEVPDDHLREILEDLEQYTAKLQPDREENGPSPRKKGRSGELNGLKSAQNSLLSEISTHLGRNKASAYEEGVIDVLLEGDGFLAGKEFADLFEEGSVGAEEELPVRLAGGLVEFWQDVVRLLHEKGVLGELVMRLVRVTQDRREEVRRRGMAALWLGSISSGLRRIKSGQRIKNKIELSHEQKGRRISSTLLSAKVEDQVHRNYPAFREASSLNILGEVPVALTEVDFAVKLLENADELSDRFVGNFMELVSPGLPEEIKREAVQLMEIYIKGEGISEIEDEDVVYTVDDLKSLAESRFGSDRGATDPRQEVELGDRTVRNTEWTMATEADGWSSCPFGILPWQLESMDTVDSLASRGITRANVVDELNVVPGLVDSDNLTTRSKIRWKSVLGKRKRTKKKRNNENVVDDVMDKAMKSVKTRG